MTSSWQVSSEQVHLFLAPHLGDPGLIPGTPRWVDLDDGDPEKWRAILWPVVYWAVDQDARQTALAEASRAISMAVDWPRIVRSRGAAYIPREVA